MFDFHEKRKFRRFLYSRVTLIVLGLLVVWLSFNVWDIYKKERDTNFEKMKQRKVLDELEEREKALKDEIERLSTERGIEEEIRSKFEVGKEGEEVIVIVASPEEENISEGDFKKSFWQKIFDWF
ncbi:MAG: septum formation initiator family protein [Candidatus Pacebacteria bacterium]|jgi:cell division protein FtsB|nr:septum formation initiator family protein [Candidatus Paceibacterota bacterium]|tara:strand:+ start:74996 stop:75370 length:375 start_codon:yes stop_codon:yes gene_type:complete